MDDRRGQRRLRTRVDPQASRKQLIKQDLLKYCRECPAFCALLNDLNSRNRYFSSEEITKLTYTRNAHSLRIIEHFVSAYQHDVEIFIDQDYNTLYGSYLHQLRLYKKELFDPFRRDHGNARISIDYIDPTTGRANKVETTYCQINFFRWAVHMSIFKLLDGYKEDVIAHMRRTEVPLDSESAKSSLVSTTIGSSHSLVAGLEGMDIVGADDNDDDSMV